MNIHHIGYLVKKGPKAQAAFEALGYIAEGEWTHDEIRKVDILFLQKDGYRIELVSPYAPDSVVSGNGYIRIDEPTPAPAIGGRRVVFLMHPAAGMLELLEEK